MRKAFLVLAILFIPYSPQILAQHGASFSSTPNVVDASCAFDSGSSNLVVNVDLVNVQFTLKDELGKQVTHVDPASLRLYEDGTQQAISYFSRETDLPLTIGILIDTSNSIRERFSFEKASALEFLTSAIRHGHDKAFLMTFGSDIRLVQDSTDDPATLASAIHQIRPGGATRLYDALLQACAERLASVEGRKVLVVISDGDDNASQINLRKTLKAAQNQDVMVYAVSTHPHAASGEHLTRPDRVLRRLAEETGGQAFFPTTSVEFAQSFERISIDVRSQFSIAYKSSNAKRDGTFRRIKIEPDHKKWVIRTRKGYFAPQR